MALPSDVYDGTLFADLGAVAIGPSDVTPQLSGPTLPPEWQTLPGEWQSLPGEWDTLPCHATNGSRSPSPIPAGMMTVEFERRCGVGGAEQAQSPLPFTALPRTPPQIVALPLPRRPAPQSMQHEASPSPGSLLQPIVQDGNLTYYVTDHDSRGRVPGAVATFNLQTSPLSTYVRKVREMPLPAQRNGDWSELMSILHSLFHDYGAAVESVTQTMRSLGAPTMSVLLHSCSPALTTAFIIPFVMHLRTAAQAVAFGPSLRQKIYAAYGKKAPQNDLDLQSALAAAALFRCMATNEPFQCLVTGCENMAQSTSVPYCEARHVKKCTGCDRKTVYPWRQCAAKMSRDVMTMCASCAIRRV